MWDFSTFASPALDSVLHSLRQISLSRSLAPGFAFLAEGGVAFLQFVKLLVGKLLYVDKIVTGRVMRANQFVQLEV